jgi:hypothetical protein
MGCACFRQKIIINSKIKGNEEENIEEYDDINNINTNYNDNINNDNQNNINMINSDNYISSSSNNIRIDSSNNLENNDSNHSNHINIDNNNNTSYIFSTFEPYLQSKYNEYFNFPEIQNEYIGKGLKRMKGYISNKKYEELKKIREDFWSSRIEGDKEIWNILKNICNDNSFNEKDIEEILKASNIKPYKNCINIVYDSKGFLYEIPNYCINLPLRYEIEEIKKDKEIPKEENINITIRNFNKEIKVLISNWKNILDLKKEIITLNEYKTIKIERIKLYFGGKELNNDKELWFYNFINQSICQMLIKEEEKINEIKINEKQNKEVLKENDTCLEEGKITEKIFNDEKIDVNETLFDKD